MSENLIAVVTIMGLLGIPSIFSMTMYCLGKCNKYTKQLKILMKSQQAQMRTKLLELHSEYTKNGYISQLQLDDWMNQYESYHELGANGVLDARKDEILKLEVK